MIRTLNKLFNFIKNLLLFLEFQSLKLFFPKRKSSAESILFVNTGQIGDLLVSSLILENENIFQCRVIFLVNEQYRNLFYEYKGKADLIFFNLKKVKYNIFYKIKLFSEIKKLNISKVYNLSPARGMIVEQLTLLSSAFKVYTICSNIIYLGKFWGSIMNNFYDEILFEGTKNEYKKHFMLLDILSKDRKLDIIFNNNVIFNLSTSEDSLRKYNLSKKEYIVIAPLTGDMKRSWGINNYMNLVERLTGKYNVVLIGSTTEINLLETVRNNNEKVSILTPQLYQMAYFIFHSRFYIGNHSGLTHFALKLNIPFLAILDGGFFDMYMPFDESNPNNNYIYNKMDCFGCQMHCIYDKMYCLTDITFENVFQKVNDILNKN